ncbi:hypothetical protein PLICRDRAFT_111469 [Plicaturopsis crispa FD-325 SS-3]|nr:hypothetical protein PLICRDRAFT_111469 [Plicaturopsis crispa FD-325 SS-3]
MSSPSVSEKGAFPVDPYAPPQTTPSKSSVSSPFSPFNVFSRFSQWRADLDLPNPGSVESLQKEVKMTHLTNYIFDGGRADLTKSMSMNPAFQVTHAFALGSQTAPSSYNFGAVFANQNVFLQGGVDHEGNVNARLNQGWSANNVTKVQAQFAHQVGHSMIQLEHDYQGRDFSLNAKAINPSPTDGSGIYVGSYFQSLTKNIALGAESMLQVAPGAHDMATSWLGKYTSTDKNWIATAQIQPAGVVQATYWQKLSQKLEVAGDIQILAAPERRDAVATLGAKYDLHAATFRAQVDSVGKVSALLEQRFAPTFAFLVSGEIDHFKNAAKFGVGVMIESSSLTPEEMGMPPQPPI